MLLHRRALRNPAPHPKQLCKATPTQQPHVCTPYPNLTASNPRTLHALLAPWALDADALALRHLRVAHRVAEREPAGVTSWGTALSGTGAKCEWCRRLTRRAKRLRLPRRRAKALEGGRRVRRAKGPRRWGGRCRRRHAKRARRASKSACNPDSSSKVGPCLLLIEMAH